MDQNFVEIIKLLNNENISYWVSNGTLLGLIRDKKLIPWDHDIDIGIFRKDISKTTLIDLMISNGYKIKDKDYWEDQGYELDYITFTKFQPSDYVADQNPQTKILDVHKLR